MAKQLECAGCHKHMGELHTYKVRTGMVVYCHECDARMQEFILRSIDVKHSDTPEFMRKFWRGFNDH